MPALPRILLALAISSALFLLVASNFALRQTITTQADQIRLQEQEARALRQQLEAERILARAQAGLLHPSPAPAPAPNP
ncbi:MAG: hypothetical protein NTU80_08520 [Verrucomicrobia bacterium]|nr:hypothetical protein [Verrucomicrobiota bacterium]